MQTPFKNGEYFALVKKEYLKDKTVKQPFWLGVMSRDGFTDVVEQAAFHKMTTNLERAAMVAYDLVLVKVRITTIITLLEAQ
jgi:hypothetical protein